MSPQPGQPCTWQGPQIGPHGAQGSVSTLFGHVDGDSKSQVTTCRVQVKSYKLSVGLLQWGGGRGEGMRVHPRDRFW